MNIRFRHCEERSDVVIRFSERDDCVQDCRASLAMTRLVSMTKFALNDKARRNDRIYNRCEP
jgi:hypothetical protein